MICGAIMAIMTQEVRRWGIQNERFYKETIGMGWTYSWNCSYMSCSEFDKDLEFS